MDRIKLPPRLAAIAALVPPGTRLADVGTDHGLLPLYLLGSGRIRSAVATDLRPGPLSRAEANATDYGAAGDIRFILCDGLDGVEPGTVDTVVIAGLGGETLAGILRRAPWTAGCTLLLQPMSRPEALRRALPELALRETAVTLVEDAGRIYQIMTVRGGLGGSYSQAELYTGRYTQLRAQPLFSRLLEEHISRLTSAANGLSLATRADPRLTELKASVAQMEEMRRRIYADCS